MPKKALIVTALARFVKSFLENDILILQSMGYEVHCSANIYHPGAECMEKYFQEMNVKFHQVDFSSNKPISRETFRSIIEMKRIINEEKFDLVHCHTPIAGAICRMVCRKIRKNGTKVIYTTHGFYFHKKSSKKTWLIYHTIENLMSRYSDALITINKEDFNSANNMKCKQVYYIPGVGVDINKFKNTIIDRKSYREQLGITEDIFLILAVGELSQRKNHKVIIKALSEANIPNAVFMICGNAMNSSNTVEEIKKLSEELNVDVRLMGLREDIPEICKCADIGVMPSIREGLGLSGIEMLAAGLPLIASGVHGILDYVRNDFNGYTCNPYESHEFAVAIKNLYDDKIRNRLKRNCPYSVEEFDLKKSHEAMKKVYEEILK